MSDEIRYNGIAECITRIHPSAELNLNYRKDRGWVAEITGVTIDCVDSRGNLTAAFCGGHSAYDAIYGLWHRITQKGICLRVEVDRYAVYMSWSPVTGEWC